MWHDLNQSKLYWLEMSWFRFKNENFRSKTNKIEKTETNPDPTRRKKDQTWINWAEKEWKGRAGSEVKIMI